MEGPAAPGPGMQANGAPVPQPTNIKLFFNPNASDVRHNVMRFHSTKDVDINNFSKPVKLHRRHPNATRAALAASTIGVVDGENASGSGAEGSGDTAPAAPKPRSNLFKKKLAQVYHADKDAWRLKQEESAPWVLEDDGGSNTWVGSLEASQAAYVVFVPHGDGFMVIPADRWYKFANKSKSRGMTLEEAEEEMTKRSKVPKWYREKLEQKVKEEQENKPVKPSGVLGRKPASASVQRRAGDEGDLDFEEEFADDEEVQLGGDDEELSKALEARIKEEQLSANAMGEAEYNFDEDEDDDKPKYNKAGKRTNKLLRNVEKNIAYGSDEENPYESEDEDTDSEDLFGDGPKQDTIVKKETSDPRSLSNLIPHRQRPEHLILKLTPTVLSRFSALPNRPWVSRSLRAVIGGPPLKRRLAGSDTESTGEMSEGSGTEGRSRKNKVPRTGSPSASSPAQSPGAAAVDPGSWITGDEMKRALGSQPSITIKGLLHIFAVKLKKNPENKPLLAPMLKKFADKLEDGKLKLKAEFA
ncbi:Rap30/74 interaction domain-containing protein [Saitoella complicata NRRL Y-17804]|nr:Rap30/74 interaction domain-containing protein [Saitoella complicata NRRL Y-17804]ODQ51861.1 Rap30/74 interaction domain-containing protein [Saitoella complicata NRRL Y-17804]